MTTKSHRFYIFSLSAIVVIVFIYLLLTGISFYETPLSERFFHKDYQQLKPSGTIGHGLGIIGTFLILTGVAIYMIRKRSRRLQRTGLLKHWLEFHIFLCTLGPVMVLYHTSFKFGGIVSISFWSMVAVFLSGVLGRFIYLQIPRSIEGRELSLSELQGIKSSISDSISSTHKLDQSTMDQIVDSTRTTMLMSVTNPVKRYFRRIGIYYRTRTGIRRSLKENKLSPSERRRIMRLVRKEQSLGTKIGRLDTMKNLFRYWHVAHLPFALVMIMIMIIHVAITITLGYKWIF